MRLADDQDLADVLAVERAAFGQDDEADLVRALLGDPSAQPSLSLIALVGARTVGHILFTKVSVTPGTGESSARILAPLAVLPDYQRRGIGGRLVEEGMRRLTASGVDLVFVLGDPTYYTRHGFAPAGRLGFDAPYPIPAEHADAWMVRALRAGAIDAASGRLSCAESLDRPEYWLE